MPLKGAQVFSRIPHVLRTAGLALVCAGCGPILIYEAHPKPNIDLDQSPQSLALGLDPAIADSFEVPAGNGIREMSVTGWQKTLTHGFDAGLAPFFKKADAADLTLVVVQADLSLTPAAYAVQANTINAQGQVIGVRAMVRYKIRLVGGDGKVLKHVSGDAISKSVVTNANDAVFAARSAVETMYEQAAGELFAAAKG